MRRSALALAGVGFLAVGYRLLPASRKGGASIDAAFTFGGYTMEAQLGAGSPRVGKTVADLEALGEDEVRITTIRPRHQHPVISHAHTTRRGYL